VASDSPLQPECGAQFRLAIRRGFERQLCPAYGVVVKTAFPALLPKPHRRTANRARNEPYHHVKLTGGNRVGKGQSRTHTGVVRSIHWVAPPARVQWIASNMPIVILHPHHHDARIRFFVERNDTAAFHV
jgi:hypothetical protein